MGSLTGHNNSLTPAFQPGVPISANALNRLAQGYEMAKTTYSDGVLYTASSGGVSYSVIPQFIPAAPGSVQQFQVNVFSQPKAAPATGVDWFIQIGAGYVVGGYVFGSIDNSAGSKMDNTRVGLEYFQINKVAVSPHASIIPNTSGDETPFVNSGAKIKLPDASIGTDIPALEVCIIRNAYPKTNNELPAFCYQSFPYLAVMQYGSDADSKTQPFITDGGGLQNYLEYISVLYGNNVTIEVYEYGGGGEPTTLNIPSVYYPQYGENHLINYNCQRLQVAQVEWDSENGIWYVDQFALGTLAMPLEITCKETRVLDGASPYSTNANYSSNQYSWYSSYAGSDVNYQDATLKYAY